jgi:hypothetical protein
MTRRQAIRLIKTQEEITALDVRSHLHLLALAIEIGKEYKGPMAKIIKGYDSTLKGKDSNEATKPR